MFCIPSSGVNPSFGTLRVCCCGRKKLPFAGYSIVKELLLSGGKDPSVARTLYLTPLGWSTARAAGGTIGEAGRRVGPPPSANAGGIRKLSKVENTGLEPVTSWLQTRRSPS